MHQLVRSGSQFVISTHSPILMAYPDAHIFLLDREGVRQVRYEETEHYAVTKSFLQDPARMLGEVFSEVSTDDDEEALDTRPLPNKPLQLTVALPRCAR